MLENFSNRNFKIEPILFQKKKNRLEKKGNADLIVEGEVDGMPCFDVSDVCVIDSGDRYIEDTEFSNRLYVRKGSSPIGDSFGVDIEGEICSDFLKEVGYALLRFLLNEKNDALYGVISNQYNEDKRLIYYHEVNDYLQFRDKSINVFKDAFNIDLTKFKSALFKYENYRMVYFNTTGTYRFDEKDRSHFLIGITTRSEETPLSGYIVIECPSVRVRVIQKDLNEEGVDLFRYMSSIQASGVRSVFSTNQKENLEKIFKCLDKNDRTVVSYLRGDDE